MKTTKLALGVASCAALAPSCKQQTPVKPNIVIIYGDDVGYGDLSCYGSTTISTPNVCRAADNGIRMTNVHATSSVSTPSRFALLTGIYPWRVPGTGIAPGDAAMIVKPEMYTIADMMGSVGYRTAAVGKWHLGLGAERGKQDWNHKITPSLEDIGFDYSFIMAATGDRVPCVYIENGEVINLDPADPIEVSYSEPFPGLPTGRDNPDLLRMTASQGHDMALINGIGRIGYMKGGTSALWVDELIGETITGKAVDFIAQSSSKGEPFFLYFGTNDIHVPRVPNEKFVGKSGMGPRGDAILSFDYSVGRVLDALDSLGIADNTIVIISSDNGPVVDDGYNDFAEELLGDHKPWGPLHERGGKYSAFEAGTRTPFVISWGKNVPIPSSLKGSTLDTPLSHIDLFASLAELVGAEIPEGAAPDSRAMWSSFCGTDSCGAEYIVEQNRDNTISILVDGWKYIRPSSLKDFETYDPYTRTYFGNSAEPQLFNLNEDLREEKNLAKEMPEKTKFLDNLLTEIIEKRDIDK